MQASAKKTSDTTKKESRKSKDETPKTSQDDKTKYATATPRNFVQKSSTADIYGHRKRITSSTTKAPKKSLTTSYTSNNASPMANLLKSTSSTNQLNSEKAKKPIKSVEKPSRLTSTPRIRDFTANSPIVKRKLNMEMKKEQSFIKDNKDKGVAKEKIKVEKEKIAKDGQERQRTKTRTLDESEVKILTGVDNNEEMRNLSKRLSAKPKAFYIDLEDEKPATSKKAPPPPPKAPSDEDISYEDDFESYESDFDSYHSSSGEQQESGTDDKEQGNEDDASVGEEEPVGTKEVKDEESMLDSGNFDLRDRSANKLKPVALDFILETAEGGEKPSSLTDEGFQEMSSSSAVSSIRTVHTEVIERPLFIDFTKSKENRRKKRIGELLRQRARDLLSIITLHEMSYSLFEMKPISYDLYMATFGRSNYTQIAVQTFEDGISEEIQTDEIETVHKWTQHPVEFTKNDICIKQKVINRKYSKNTEDYLTKFTFLTANNVNIERNNEINLDDSYKMDPLRIYFEQKDGVGPSEILPYDTYKSKLKDNDYNSHRLAKFLKRHESKISSILNANNGNTELSDLNISNLPFSRGYVSVSTKNITSESMTFLSKTKISKMCFSDTNSNLLMTVHRMDENAALKKCTICLWNISVATQEPLKLLTAVDDVCKGRLRGSSDGYFVGALEDGSVHLWDLSEEPTWRDDVASEAEPTKLVEINEKGLTEVEKDREWNNKNSNIGLDKPCIHCALQSCAYTNSAFNMSNGDVTDHIVGLEVTGDAHCIVSQEGGRRIMGQVVTLQTIGILSIWCIVQQKSKTVPPDIGKAFWSKMKLEKLQTIRLTDHIDIPIKCQNGDFKPDFNLHAAKRRMLNRKQEKSIIKNVVSRPKSAMSMDFDIDRPASAASGKMKRVLSVEKNVSKNWENGVVCRDLKVMTWKDRDYYLIAKNCGEILCCRRILGTVKVNTFCIATDASSVNCIEVSFHQLPYFLAATDTGTISVCSLLDNRVLLTLDCRNIQPKDMEKYHSDHKGRYISSSSVTRSSRISVISLSWSHINPCCIFACLQDESMVQWELSYSDIHAKRTGDAVARGCMAADNSLALLTPAGEVNVHRLSNEQRTKEFLILFEKYLALL
ncbi:uncharacterized protein LOC111351200 [Spodoptera litura]|uniref:Uncharacterized protein LOC111351200 n=1 Tax=Spodoptera litura TaxID=69820 RepID=A0A9J7DZW7_SPOLT|nr:uncharacterized protein LOC111351200 [Spodoptera litura]